jgi:hypothetical protein
VYALCSGSEREERSVHSFLNGLVRSTMTVMTRVELGDMRTTGAPLFARGPHTARADWICAYAPECVEVMFS